MKKLNETEIQEFAERINMSYEDAKETADIFYSEKEKGNYRFQATELNDVRAYSYEWDCSWYRYKTFDELIESEADQGSYGLTEQECIDLKDEAIFWLKSGLYIQTVY